MKLLIIIALTTLLVSCSSRQSETDQLNQRIIELEQRVDSITGKEKNYSQGFNKESPVFEGNRCMAKTKKGSQCKRKPKGGAYCWQHGR